MRCSVGAVVAESPVRGSLRIADRVAVRIAGHVAREVPGVLPRQASTRQLTPSYPHVTGSVTDGRAQVEIEVAVAWGSRSDEVAREVQERVWTALTTLVGLTSVRVGVVVASIAEVDGEGRVQ